MWRFFDDAKPGRSTRWKKKISQKPLRRGVSDEKCSRCCVDRDSDESKKQEKRSSIQERQDDGTHVKARKLEKIIGGDVRGRVAGARPRAENATRITEDVWGGGGKGKYGGPKES